MKIILVRHGKSKMNHTCRVNCAEFKQWIQEYDALGIEQSVEIHQDHILVSTKNILMKVKHTVSSDLKRAFASSMQLIDGQMIESDVVYREVNPPTFNASMKWLKLKPLTWLVMMRLLWLLGYSNETESKKEVRTRITHACEKLIGKANKYDEVALIGHGYTNYLIGKELCAQGWYRISKENHHHWGHTVYQNTK